MLLQRVTAMQLTDVGFYSTKGTGGRISPSTQAKLLKMG